MDELVIGEKRYVSSKKAAKLTGYAKDYVGQLCREGKVEARLVGRNWYVLEESIMEHRFGPAESTKEAFVDEKTTEIDEKTEEYGWNPAKYTSEPTESLPTVNSSISSAYTPEIEEKEPEIRTESLTTMQEAWQEWFKEKEVLVKEQEATLPDGSEMLLPEGENEQNVLEIEQNEAISTQKDPDFSAVSVPLTIHRKVEEPTIRFSEPMRSPQRENFVVINQKREPEYAYIPRETREIPVYRSSLQEKKIRNKAKLPLFKVVIFAFLGLMVAATYLSLSSANASEEGGNNPVVNYLNGVSSVHN